MSRHSTKEFATIAGDRTPLAAEESPPNWKRNLLPVIAFAAAVPSLHLLLRAAGTEYGLTQLTMAAYYAIVVVGLGLLIGYAGQVSLAHGAFFAIGGYTSAVLTTHDFSKWQAQLRWLQDAHIMVAREDLYGTQMLTVTPWAAFVMAMVVVLLAGSLIGYPALRLRGHYLAMATLGFGLIVARLLMGTNLTGAADGISGVPEWKLAPGFVVSGKIAVRTQNYYLACALLLVVLVLLRNTVQSRIGRALKSIHDGEKAANAMGINTAAYKLKAFLISAALAAGAGVFFTHYTGGIGPSEAGALKSLRYVALAAAGGMSNLWRVAIVSMVLNYASLRGWFGSYDNAVFGILLILIIAVAPTGPLQPAAAWLRRRKWRRFEQASPHGTT
jgi:branched-chain amino acid transport system permease protein